MQEASRRSRPCHSRGEAGTVRQTCTPKLLNPPARKDISVVERDPVAAQDADIDALKKKLDELERSILRVEALLRETEMETR